MIYFTSTSTSVYSVLITRTMGRQCILQHIHDFGIRLGIPPQGRTPAEEEICHRFSLWLRRARYCYRPDVFMAHNFNAETHVVVTPDYLDYYRS